MSALDLWVLGLFQGEEGGPAWGMFYAALDLMGIELFMRIGTLAEQQAGGWWCTCGAGEAEEDRSAVLRCPVHGARVLS